MKCFALFITLISLTAAAQPVLTLNEAYLAAVEKTENIAIQKARVQQADAAVAQSKADMLPRISAEASYTHQGFRTPPGEGKSFLSANQSATGLSLNQTLFQGGELYAGYKSSQYDLQTARFNLQDEKVSLYLQVAQTYYDVLQVQKEIENFKTTIGLTRQLIGELQRREKIGRSRLSEVLSAQSQLAVSESQLQSALGRKTVFFDQLALATNLDPAATPVTLILDLPTKISSLESYLSKKDQRPDLLALESQLSSQKELVKVAKAGHLPTIDLTGDYFFSQTGSRSDVEWAAGVSLSFPLFEGGAVRGAVREEVEKQTEYSLILSQAKRAAEAAIRSAYHSLQSSLAEIESLEKAVNATNRNYLQQKKDYGFSLVTNLDVLQALSSYHQTKLTLDQTRIKAAKDWAQLQASVAEIPR